MTMTKSVRGFCPKFAIVNGAGAATNIAVSGIATEDTLIFVHECAASSGAPTDRTAQCTITSAGNIQCSQATTSDKLAILYHDASAQGYSAFAPKFALLSGAAADTNIAVTGIATEDTIVFCFEVDGTSGIWTDRTAETNITSAGNIQLDTTATTGDKLVLCYHDASAAGYPAFNWQHGQGTVASNAATITGLAAGDTILFSLGLTATDFLAEDNTATTEITGANAISLTATDDDEAIVWYIAQDF